MKIVLLSGKQGSGKTTLQKALIRKWNDEQTNSQSYLKKFAFATNFADVIYEMHDAVLKILHRYWPDRGLKKDGPLLQVLGTQWGRETIDQDVWVKVLRSKIKRDFESDQYCGLIVIGDCRFENEFDAFPDALRVRLYCPEKERKERCEMWRENKTHASEIGLDQYYLNGKFDLVLTTHKAGIDDCVERVFSALNSDFVAHRSRVEKKSHKIFL